MLRVTGAVKTIAYDMVDDESEAVNIVDYYMLFYPWLMYLIDERMKTDTSLYNLCSELC